ncbi:MAG: glycosyltransferase [Mucilaginibacter sp.]
MLSQGASVEIDKKGLPKLSVIVVTFNAATTLQNCLNSIYRQSYPNIELIIIDGKSEDNTTKILQENTNNIYYWKSEKDGGIYDAMNKGLEHITGDWVYFLGADDELTSDFSAMAAELKDLSAIYYGSVWSDDRKCRGYVTDYIIAKYGVFHQAVLYPKAVFNKFKYDTRYKVRADHVLNMQFVKDHQFHFVFKDYILAKYNHEGLSNNYIDEQFEKDQSALVLENFGLKIWLRFKFWRLKRIFKKTGKDDATH